MHQQPRGLSGWNLLKPQQLSSRYRIGQAEQDSIVILQNIRPLPLAVGTNQWTAKGKLK
jgi:hypothetical protein